MGYVWSAAGKEIKMNDLSLMFNYYIFKLNFEKILKNSKSIKEAEHYYREINRQRSMLFYNLYDNFSDSHYLFGTIWAKITGEKWGDSKIEEIFYYLLRGSNISFEFQKKIGNIHVDFLIGENLIIEIDGPQHWKNENQIRSDEIRDKKLESSGFTVLRIRVYSLVMEYKRVIRLIKCLDKKFNRPAP